MFLILRDCFWFLRENTVLLLAIYGLQFPISYGSSTAYLF